MRDRKPGNTRPRSLKKPIETDLGFSWGMPNTVLMGLGFVALAAGYVLLSMGSTTVAPVLLVGGYCVLIPASLVVRGRKAGE